MPRCRYFHKVTLALALLLGAGAFWMLHHGVGTTTDAMEGATLHNDPADKAQYIVPIRTGDQEPVGAN